MASARPETQETISASPPIESSLPAGAISLPTDGVQRCRIHGLLLLGVLFLFLLLEPLLFLLALLQLLLPPLPLLPGTLPCGPVRHRRGGCDPCEARQHLTARVPVWHALPHPPLPRSNPRLDERWPLPLLVAEEALKLPPSPNQNHTRLCDARFQSWNPTGGYIPGSSLARLAACISPMAQDQRKGRRTGGPGGQGGEACLRTFLPELTSSSSLSEERL